jgi:hypothetical protein
MPLWTLTIAGRAFPCILRQENWVDFDDSSGYVQFRPIHTVQILRRLNVIAPHNQAAPPTDSSVSASDVGGWPVRSISAG